MGAAEVKQFLSHLTVEKQVAASTQDQTLAAVLFLYKDAPGQALPWLNEITRAKRPERLPVVLTVAETQALLGRMSGTTG